MLKIEKDSDGRSTLIRLIGRVRSCDLDELREQMQSSDSVIVLDFDQVTLVDVDVVRFLCHCKERGVQVAQCSPYILEWIVREQHAGLRTEGESDAFR
jgi:anti-anti-sigma regulatory factor